MKHLSRLIVATLLAFVVASAIASEPRPTTLDHLANDNVYLVVYQPGTSWAEGKPLREQQAMTEHFLYYLALHRAGRLVAGGRFSSDRGGSAVFQADSDEAAAAFLDADPAVKAGTFSYVLHRWHLNPWEEISRKRAAAGG